MPLPAPANSTWCTSQCPTDAHGRTATDVVLDYLAHEFSSTGRCARAHGIAFDAPYEKPFSASKFLPDLNNDGSGADDAAENYDSYTHGYYTFLKRLRERMGPNFILTADARDDVQRAVSLLNGMESEGWPYRVKDPYLTAWSAGFNLFQYWKRGRSQLFDANFAHLKDLSGVFTNEGTRPPNLTRLVLAGIVCNGAIVTAALLPNPGGASFPTNLWDEGTRGVDGVHNWLGVPRGPIIRLATNAARPVRRQRHQPHAGIHQPVEFAGRHHHQGERLPADSALRRWCPGGSSGVCSASSIRSSTTARSSLILPTSSSRHAMPCFWSSCRCHR